DRPHPIPAAVVLGWVSGRSARRRRAGGDGDVVWLDAGRVAPAGADHKVGRGPDADASAVRRAAPRDDQGGGSQAGDPCGGLLLAAGYWYRAAVDQATASVRKRSRLAPWPAGHAPRR